MESQSMPSTSFNEFKKFQQRGTHQSLHLNLETSVENERFVKYMTIQEQIERQNGTKSIWVHINEQNLHICGSLVKMGFQIHNGLGKRIEVYKWLKSQEDLVPPYSMFYIGCGGIVIDEGGLLLVQENNGPRTDEWGLPGGLLNKGETIREGAEREVWQQTGLKTDYQYIFYFRELNKSIHNSVDIYFVCYLKLREGVTRNSLNLCSRQIKDHRWVPLDHLQEFMNNNKFNGTQKVVVPIIIDLHKKGFKFSQSMPNETMERDVISRGIEKKYVEHKIINL